MPQPFALGSTVRSRCNATSSTAGRVVLAPAYLEPLEAPVPVLGQWANTVTLLCGAAVPGLGLAAEPFVRSFTASQLLPW